ncbi:MAG TPA: sigma-70 family RNA polymerase sigma factor [Bacilli bacterium]|nr:sigma-70 family RNA polymerase sigma factor [Bacilli bacterium]
MDELFQQYHKTGDIALRNKIIEQSLNLIHFVVRRMKRRSFLYNYEYDDLVSYGYFGLIQAVEKYDVTKGYKFSTYAIKRIQGAILDEIRRDDWVPRDVRSKLKHVREDLAWCNQLGCMIDSQALCAHYNLDEREYSLLMNNLLLTYDDAMLYSPQTHSEHTNTGVAHDSIF